MKRSSVSWLIIVGLLFLGILPGRMSLAETVVLGSGTWVPFTGENLPEQGTKTKLVKEAFAQVGITTQRVEMPWARVLNVLGTNIDGGYPLGHSLERDAKFLYSDKIGLATRYIFHLKTRLFEWNTVDDLKDLQIGIVRGARFGPLHDQLLNRIESEHGFATIQEVDEDKQNLLKLLSGRVDVVFGEFHQTTYLLKKLQAQEIITYHPHPLMDATPFYVIFPKSTRGEYLREQFNKGLNLLQESTK